MRWNVIYEMFSQLLKWFAHQHFLGCEFEVSYCEIIERFGYFRRLNSDSRVQYFVICILNLNFLSSIN